MDLGMLRGDEQWVKTVQRKYLDCFTSSQQYILDLGCGRGEFLELLREQGKRGLGLDIDPLSIEQCRAKGLFNVVKDDCFTFLPGHKSCFDGIFMSHVIEHYAPDDVHTLLSLCYGALVPWGRIVIITPNTANLFVITENFWKDLTHVRPYPIDAMKLLLSKSGFTVIHEGLDPDTVSKIPEEAKPPFWGQLHPMLGHFFSSEDAFVVGEKPSK